VNYAALLQAHHDVMQRMAFAALLQWTIIELNTLAA
jgi:hypothetical protein